jgi:hypothetical protein
VQPISTFKQFDQDIVDHIMAAANSWLASPARPVVSDGTLSGWDGLISAWLADQDMPLLVRNSKGRGRAVQHPSGRMVVCCDNAPANWCLAMALMGRTPDTVEIIEALESGLLPIQMMASKKDLAECRYQGCLARVRNVPNLNTLGWKICHIERVGLNDAREIDVIPIAQIEEAHRRLLSPRNMFLVPKVYAGLGETPEFVSVFDRISRSV